MLTRLNENKYIKFFYWFLVLGACVAFFFDTYENGHDFDVFYRAGYFFLKGQSIYSLERDHGMIFKYPPWFAVIFSPLALLPVYLAKGAWGLLGAISFLSIQRSLTRFGFSFLSIALPTVCFWGIWAVHFIDGQVEIPVLAVFLLLLEKNLKTERLALTSSVLLLMSIKITSGVAAFGVITKKNLLKLVMVSSVIGIVSSLVIGMATGDGASIIPKWLAAAQSGSAYMEVGKSMGRDNQGIPAAFDRSLNMPKDHKFELERKLALMILFLGTAIFLFLFRGLPKLEKSFFWLSAAVVLHPLAWFHLFVWTLPLLVWVTDKALQQKKYRYWLLTPLLVGLVTEKTMGDLGKWLEFYSFKSWVVTLTLIYFSFYLSKTRLKKL